MRHRDAERLCLGHTMNTAHPRVDNALRKARAEEGKQLQMAVIYETV